jgi:spermidine/putrescine transport system substrate-binding protein
MNSFVRTGLVRVLMVLFWIAVIFIFLFLPSASSLFFQKKSLNLFIWPMILDPKVLADFEKETGIKVYVNYYESNEELYSKLQATAGKGYDIIVPTDYMVELLIQDNLLKKIDTTKLDFMSDVRPYLLHHYFDPTNDYSVPYYLTVFGLGINKDFFGGGLPDASWALVFDKEKAPQSLCMIDSPREALLLAGYYLYGTIDHLGTPDRLKAIEQLLIEQKQWTYVYTSFRIEELLASKSCPLAVGTNTDVWKAQREYSHIAFAVPHEGSFVAIDSFVIPKATHKDDLVYMLINFLYRRTVVYHNSHKHGFCSPLVTVKQDDPTIFCPTPEQFERFHFFANVLSKQEMQDAWIAIKSY